MNDFNEIIKLGLKTIENLSEGKVNEASTISVPKLSDIDHTRIIKWMSNLGLHFHKCEQFKGIFDIIFKR
jgi:hypothetical protein